LEITTLGGDRQLLRARHVIYIQRTLPMPDLYQALEGEIGECYWIGDAAPGSPAYLHGAIRQGAEVGLRI
jgi:hypothetical protein